MTQENSELEKWLNSDKFFEDKQNYDLNINDEVKSLALSVWKRETYFIYWYMNSKHQTLDNKTPYEYAKLNGTTEVKRIINGLISPPAT